jgi:hypothetical protein
MNAAKRKTGFHRTFALLVLTAAGCRALLDDEFWIVGVTSPPDDLARAAATGETQSPLGRRTVVSREPMGDFVLIVEHDTTPRLPFGWKPETLVHLFIETPDRRTNLSLVDDGGSLSVEGHSPGCSVGVRYLQHRPRDETYLLNAMRTGLGFLVTECAAGMANPDDVRRLLGDARPWYPTAYRAWEDRVRQAFGRRIERSRRPDPNEHVDIVY